MSVKGTVGSGVPVDRQRTPSGRERSDRRRHLLVAAARAGHPHPRQGGAHQPDLRRVHDREDAEGREATAVRELLNGAFVACPRTGRPSSWPRRASRPARGTRRPTRRTSTRSPATRSRSAPTCPAATPSRRGRRRGEELPRPRRPEGGRGLLRAGAVRDQRRAVPRVPVRHRRRPPWVRLPGRDVPRPRSCSGSPATPTTSASGRPTTRHQRRRHRHARDPQPREPRRTDRPVTGDPRGRRAAAPTRRRRESRRRRNGERRR
jgi:hypothetical protein